MIIIIFGVTILMGVFYLIGFGLCQIAVIPSIVTQCLGFEIMSCFMPMLVGDLAVCVVLAIWFAYWYVNILIWGS
ncbi:MAG: hypothetical protein PHE59_02855 [Patescibacteria group bacterium]|nr:hypothetical protein [Patescibacteria group bacterium]MDD5164895.1 hypothetical protein [Patescibacteria group bacterium]MDD5534615.1 hypothetical protein [Patescibacteria group bacterium]